MIYKVLGEGFVIGEELRCTRENIWLKYPAVLKMFPGQKQNEVIFKCVDLVPNFFDDFESLIKKFPLKQNLVYMRSKPDPTANQLYGQYLKKLTRRLMNIEIVGADALKNLPKPPDGGHRKQ